MILKGAFKVNQNWVNNKIEDSGCKMRGSGYMMQATDFRVLDASDRTQESGASAGEVTKEAFVTSTMFKV